MTTEPYNQEQIEKITKAATQQAEELAKYGKSGFEAWIKSANILMDGAQTMFKTLTAYNNDAREYQAAAMKQFMSCKTLNDMTETSTKVAQESLEKAMTTSTTLSEKSIKLYMDSIEPINDQMSKGFQETVKKAQKSA